MPASTKPLIVAGLVALGAALPMASLWGFTVDDALISARVAHQLATGHGYRFNPAGPIVDAVTPLGWAPLLAGFARSGPEAALNAAKWLGGASWLVAASWLGTRFARFGGRALVVGASGLLFGLPIAAWAVSGMETGLVTALATFALDGGVAGWIALGVAAGLRPELAPWAATLAACETLSSAGSPPQRVRRTLGALCFALGPFLLVALLRERLFGVAYPLAALAKPADLGSGLRYALGALVFSGPAYLLLGGRAWRAVSPRARWISLSALLHLVVIVLVGGDWMPFYRLLVPILPGIVLVGAELAQRSSWTASVVRLIPTVIVALMLAFTLGPSARRVTAQRGSLIRGARPLLRGAQRVAALDVGWVGVATAAPIVDLAGVTDPNVARLPGGHTSKRLPVGFLEDRQIDALVLLAQAPDLSEWPELHFARAVEDRVVHLASAERFEPVGVLPLVGTSQAYVVARRRPDRE
jgi:hypothetical protein